MGADDDDVCAHCVGVVDDLVVRYPDADRPNRVDAVVRGPVRSVSDGVLGGAPEQVVDSGELGAREQTEIALVDDREDVECRALVSGQSHRLVECRRRRRAPVGGEEDDVVHTVCHGTNRPNRCGEREGCRREDDMGGSRNVRQMYDRLLVPTDGSRGTERAVDQAIALATRFDAHVDALAVVDETSAATEYDMVVEALEREAEAALDAVTNACAAAGISSEPHLRRGRPHEVILAAANAYGTDLIVMGTNGRSGLDRLRHLGSVTERVVRTSSVPVLATPLTSAEGHD